MNYLMIAAHMASDDGRWRRLAKLSADHGMLRQAIYCLTKLLARARGDLDAQWDRAVLYAQVGEPRQALRGFQRLARARPGDGGVAKWVARTQHALRDPGAAAATLEALLRDHAASADLTHVNMLAELRLAAGDAAAARDLVASARARWASGGALPADLEVKAAAAAAATGDVDGAEALLDACLATADAPADLLEAGADVLADAGRPGAAAAFYVRAAAQTPPDAPGGASLWARMAAAARSSGGDAAEAAACRSLLADAAAAARVHAAAALRLAELSLAAGDAGAAAALLPTADAGAGAAGDSDAVAARKAELLLELGDVEGFLATALPLARAALDRADAAADLRTQLEPGVRKALARRAGRGGGAAGAPPAPPPDGDAAAVFKGYEGRDRRKPHVRRADEAAAGLVAAADGGDGVVVAAAAAAAAGRGEPLPAAGFRLATRAARALLDAGRTDDAAALLTRLARFTRRPRRADDGADALAVLHARAALACGDRGAAAPALRDVCGRRPHCNAAWNVYARAAAAAGAARAAPRWLAAAVDAGAAAAGTSGAPATPPLPPLVLLGAAHACGGDPARGAAELAAARAAAPGEPLPALCLAVALATLATSRGGAAGPADRDRVAAAALAHGADYASARGVPAEAAYNLGRLAHGLGLPAAAAGLYARALAASDAAAEAKPAAGAAPPPAPPTPEAAHNLALLLRASGANDAARRVLRRWATV